MICVGQAAEEGSVANIKGMVELFPECWSIIVDGEELMRVESLPQILGELRSDASQVYVFVSSSHVDAVCRLLGAATGDKLFW